MQNFTTNPIQVFVSSSVQHLFGKDFNLWMTTKYVIYMSRRSSVSIVTRLQAELPGPNSRQGQWRNFVSSSPRPDRLWGPTNV